MKNQIISSVAALTLATSALAGSVTVKIWNDSKYDTVCVQGATPTECLKAGTGKAISLTTDSGYINAKLGTQSQYTKFMLSHNLPQNKPNGTWVCKGNAIFSVSTIHPNYWMTQGYYEVASDCGSEQSNSYYPRFGS